MKGVNIFKHLLLNLPGWRSSRKIVVFESDDWGSIRSNRRYLKAIETSEVNLDLYDKYDHLESSSDLQCLFEILSEFEDNNGRKPIITANTVLGNPDFDRIESNNFEDYYWQSISETFAKEYPDKATFDLWKLGVKENLLKPQFHGREHLNVQSWMQDLRADNVLAKKAFDSRVFCYRRETSATRNNHMAAFDHHSQSQRIFISGALNEGLKAFESEFGFKSKTMIAPCYVWDFEIEQEAALLGVKGFQGMRYQLIPTKNGYKKKMHFLGEKNARGITYLVRNAFFEPTHFGIEKSIADVLLRAKICFLLGKPLVIGTHRINFMGGLVEDNRKENLSGFKKLLTELLGKFKDIEFMASDELVELINAKND